MEIYDCAFPQCEGILVTDSIERAFNDIDVCLLVGSKPRGPGQERGRYYICVRIVTGR